LSSRRYRITRLGARAVTLVAFAAAILIGVEAAARAQQAGGQPEQTLEDQVVADGVTVGGVSVGGLTAEEAVKAVQAAASRPVTVAFRSRAWRYAPQTLGATADVDAAVRKAVAAPRGAAVDLDVQVDELTLQRWTRRFARRFDQKTRNAAVVLHGTRPVVTRARFGRELMRWSTRTQVLLALRGHETGPVRLPSRVLRPQVTNRKVGLAIVVKRASNELVLYGPGGRKGMRVKKVFGVATGQAAYPTPLGSYEIVTKQRYPTWYPPDSDWAEGAEPIPPGPGNPLGTRWMGLSAPAVGIHGTPDAASIGYSASHGCIRMLVPEAEWLFDRVTEGTPVYIVDA
jgi:lipoprotein-anchoring transpeptidase ErfK/SrfK